MDNQSSHDAIVKCEQFTRKELIYLKEKGIWGSWYPVMERLLNRSLEMGPVYEEICDKLDSSSINSIPFRLTLEAIWASEKFFSPKTIARKKDAMKELVKLHEDIPLLAKNLCDALQHQRKLLEQEDFDPGAYLHTPELLSLASNDNGRYSSFIEEEIDKLDSLYDTRYWPSVDKLISAVGDFEASSSIPIQNHLPTGVMDGRVTILKDFVLSFEADLQDTHQIPDSFTFSTASMATIVNIVLDLPDEKIATPEAVRIIRKRRKDGMYGKESLTPS